jgi:hypothetical protein
MGETIGQDRLQFNGSLRIEAREERLSSNGGAILVREYAERIGILDWLGERLSDPRRQDLITHPFRELLLSSLLLSAQGYEDQDDADSLRNDPAFRLAVSTRKGDAALRSAPKGPGNPGTPEGLPSQPTLSRMVFELGTEDNRRVLREALAELACRRMQEMRQRRDHLTIDVDDLPIYVEGDQIGAAYHPYYHAKIYRPLVVSVAETGDILDVVLRKGTAHSSEKFDEVLPDLLDRIEGKLCLSASVRIDAGFQGERVYSVLEKRKTPYVGRLKPNAALDKLSAPYLVRPDETIIPKEPRAWFYEYGYRAGSWSRFRRVILVVLEKPGQLWLDHFWLVTSWDCEEMSPAELLPLYRKRGSAEDHMGQWVNTLRPRLSSAARTKRTYRGNPVKKSIGMGYPFEQNEVTLLLSALSYNLMHGVRVLVEKKTRKGWSLQRLRERVLLVASRFLLHSRQVVMTVGTGVAPLWEGALDELRKIQYPRSPALDDCEPEGQAA